jgi:hypothetical protein
VVPWQVLLQLSLILPCNQSYQEGNQSYQSYQEGNQSYQGGNQSYQEGKQGKHRQAYQVLRKGLSAITGIGFRNKF